MKPRQVKQRQSSSKTCQLYKITKAKTKRTTESECYVYSFWTRLREQNDRKGNASHRKTEGPSAWTGSKPVYSVGSFVSDSFGLRKNLDGWSQQVDRHQDLQMSQRARCGIDTMDVERLLPTEEGTKEPATTQVSALLK